jgi:arylsulfatase A-like enzyme
MSHLSLIGRRALVALAVVLGPGAFVASAQPKPNVIVLFSDDAGYADFGFMNQFTGQTTEFKTPNLDALAAGGVKMSAGYVAAPVCSVSRAGLLTGRFPSRFGVVYNFSNLNSPNDGVPTSEALATELMKQAGYTTGVFGKWHVGAEVAKQPQSNSVDTFFGVLGGGRPYFGTGGDPVYHNTTVSSWTTEPSYNNIPADPTLKRNFTDAIGDEASKFVADNANQANPFFMYVPFTAPHSPYDLAKADDVAQFDGTSLTGLRKNVAASTYAMDRAVGNIMARVNDPDGNPNTNDSIADNTIIVFMNDNGGNFPTDPPAQGQMVHDNSPLRDYKGSMFEGGIRVPMVIKAPGLAAGVYNQSVSSVDLLPTFLAAAGAAVPGNMDGVNLLPYLNGSQTGPAHDTLFWSGGVNGWAVRQGNWKLVKANQGAFVQLYQINANGTGEQAADIKTGQQPAIYQSMLKDFVDYEATLAKATTTTLSNISYLNLFDAVRVRTDLSTD